MVKVLPQDTVQGNPSQNPASQGGYLPIHSYLKAEMMELEN